MTADRVGPSPRCDTEAHEAGARYCRACVARWLRARGVRMTWAELQARYSYDPYNRDERGGP